MPGPVLPGLHPLFLMLGLAALCAPARLLAQPGPFACAHQRGRSSWPSHSESSQRTWIVRIPFVGNIGHIYDVFVTAALVPLHGAERIWRAGAARRRTRPYERRSCS